MGNARLVGGTPEGVNSPAKGLNKSPGSPAEGDRPPGILGGGVHPGTNSPELAAASQSTVSASTACAACIEGEPVDAGEEYLVLLDLLVRGLHRLIKRLTHSRILLIKPLCLKDAFLTDSFRDASLSTGFSLRMVFFATQTVLRV
jgi:hypothetical protein